LCENLGRLVMSIWFNCKKCGEALAAVEKKAGDRVACPKCRARNKIPGIAMQSQVTKEQIEQLRTQLNRHRQSLWILFILLFLGIGLSLLGVKFFIGVGILVGIIFAVLVPILKTCEHLGVNKVINILLFFFLSVIWMIVCVILYLELKKRIEYLKKAGNRVNES